MKKGNVILLNGVSSSGKTTLTKKLQDKSNDNLVCISSDTFCNMWPEKIFKLNFEEEFLHIQTVMYHTVKLFLNRGIDVVFDGVLLSPYNGLGEFVSLLQGFSILFVHVTCPIDELRRRETDRGDRLPGQAESQLQYLVPQDTYDLTVDTFLTSVDDCVDKILQMARHPNQWSAFKELCAQASFE